MHCDKIRPMAEKFFEQKFDQPEEERQKEQIQTEAVKAYEEEAAVRENIEDRNDAFRFDRMVYDADTARKLNARETYDDLKDSLFNDPLNSDLAHLKEKVIDPLASLKVYQSDHWLHEKTRELFDERYERFRMPGYERYNFKAKRQELVPPTGISFGLQKLALKKAHLLKDEAQIVFFAGGEQPDEAEEMKRHGLIISNGRDEQLESPSMALFNTLRRTGHYDHEGLDEKKNLTAYFNFAKIVERNEWLEGAIRNFYDENDMTLFKINRLLPTETLTAMLRDMTADIKFDPRNFARSEKEIRETLFIRAAAKLTPEMIAKYHLDEKDAKGKSIIDKQKESIQRSREYLRDGRNATDKSNFGRTVYVKSDGQAKADKLPGGLPAIAAEPPRGKNGWRQPNVYCEVLNAHLLTFVRKSQLNGLVGALGRAARSSGLNVQTTPIGEWMKIFIPFDGQPDEKVVAAFEKKAFGKPPVKKKEALNKYRAAATAK